ncbi:MAG: CehA/McbA family metallohydrolase [Clostridia bacterium]|nr:CehA/McbA family metallohydrolase [Clostridia bacterium]
MFQDEQGCRWLKGNLHTHTTRSDGKASPEESAALYREHGYDFLALTDHWVVSENESVDGLLLLSGAEYNFGQNVREGIFHIVGTGMEHDPGVTRQDSPQTCVDKIRAAGGLVHLAHPAWSLNTPEQIASLTGLDAAEIYNSVSGLPRNCRPDSGFILDLCAAQGNFLPLIAADDTHFYYEADTCRSFIRVRADECSRRAILAAVRRGDFYATQGPHLTVTREDRILRVRCSPASAVICYTDTVWENHRADTGENLTEAQFTAADAATFARIEVIDAQGNRAWSPFFDMH